MINLPGARSFAQNLLRKGLSPKLIYHSYEHTCYVVKQALHLASAERVSEYDMVIIEVAAWFHDTGFVNTYSHHEEESCIIASSILKEMGSSNLEIETVCNLILDTKVPQRPRGDLSKILCDADLYYLGSDSFSEISERLKKEWLHFGIIKNEEEFIGKQLEFLSNHQYFTATARNQIESLKKKTFQQLIEKYSLTKENKKNNLKKIIG